MKLAPVLIIALAALSYSGREYRPSYPKAIVRPVVNLPLVYFWGIARAESDFDARAIGPDGHDRGMWQFREFYDGERGLVDPFDPIESTQKAITLFTKNLAYLGSIDKAISAHRRGRAWVIRNGLDREYLARVKGE